MSKHFSEPVFIAAAPGSTLHAGYPGTDNKDTGEVFFSETPLVAWGIQWIEGDTDNVDPFVFPVPVTEPGANAKQTLIDVPGCKPHRAEGNTYETVEDWRKTFSDRYGEDTSPISG